MASIPAVYQSPERFDANTNYLVPVGATAAFADARANPPRRWEDGIENIAILLEVDNEAAVPWTAPRDWQFVGSTPSRWLGNLRHDGFFAGWGGGALPSFPRERIRTICAMFTVDGGESFQASAVCQLAMADAGPATPVAIASASPGVVPTGRTNTALAIRSESRLTVAATGDPRTLGTPPTELADLARQAFAAGLDLEGTQLAMAAFLIDEPTATVQYHWIPALRRPATIVRFGVGVDYTGPNSTTMRRQLANVDDSRGQPLSKLSSLVGDLADPLFERPSPPRRYAGSRRTADRSAGCERVGHSIRILGVADPRTLLRAAQIDEIDVLLIFDVEEKTTRSGTKSKAAEFIVLDVWSGRDLLNVRRINYLRRKNRGRRSTVP